MYLTKHQLYLNRFFLTRHTEVKIKTDLSNILYFRFMMIPFLYLEPLLQAPAGHPASEAEVIQLIWGAVNMNFCGGQEGHPS